MTLYHCSLHLLQRGGGPFLGKAKFRLLFLLSLLVACDPGQNDGPQVRGVFGEVDVATDDRVVATVDGVPITASRVSKLVKKTGRTPREVVERLIDFELLAAEANRRGLAEHYAVQRAARQEMVQRFLEQTFESSHSPDAMPESLLKSSYRKNIRSFIRPKLYKVAHILVKADIKTSSKSQRTQAHRLAQEIYREALAVKTAEEFHELFTRKQGASGFKLQSEELIVSKTARLVKEFIDATLNLENKGDVSPPVDTQYGTHVIFLIDTREELSRTFEDAIEEVREKEHPFWIKREFFTLTEELRHSALVIGYSGPKQRAQQ